LAISFN